MIEKHVTSLDISKRLKELGVEKKSLFYWIQEGENFELGQFTFGIPTGKIVYPAYLSTELLEWLPKILSDQNKEYNLSILYNNDYNIYDICYTSIHYDIEYLFHNNASSITEVDKLLQNALAKMLIYLVENGLIILPKPEK